MITNFLFYVGDCEDQMLAGILVKHCNGFHSPHEAVSAFLEVIREHLRNKHTIVLNKCCAEQKGKFCSECGTKLGGVTSRFNYAEFVGEVDAFFSASNDSAFELIEAFELAGWDFSVFPSGEECVVTGMERLAESYFKDEMTTDEVVIYLQTNELMGDEEVEVG